MIIAPDPAAGAPESAPFTQGTIGAGGKRIWLYPREISGNFTRRRQRLAWVLMAVYLGFPWLRWQGEPLLRLDAADGKLAILSRYFWAQDIPLFLPGIFAFFLLLILVTARFGRVWCGWACPQTVFLQFLFYPLEKWMEGKASERRRRDALPITPAWLGRKLLKHILFAAAAFLIANTALAYFWGTNGLLRAMAHPSAETWPGLAFVLVFAVLFYGNFAFFREQACILVCPYARFQSVLFDEKTTVVAYDSERGEPRGKLRGGKRSGLGDCTDCRQCVEVCPTGIDIRMGQQLECIGCTRCIDACDRTMAAWKKPGGLIRHAALQSERGRPWRLLAYGALAAVLFAVSAVFVLSRSAVGLDLVRRGQAPYTKVGADSVLNTFTLHIRNRGTRPAVLAMKAQGAARGTLNGEGRPFTVPGGRSLSMPIDIVMPATEFRRGRLALELTLAGERISATVPVTLAGPWGH